MDDKLYVGVINFKSTGLVEAGKALQEYLDLGLDPILTDSDVLMTISEYAKTLQQPTDYIDVLGIYTKEGKEIRGWHVEVERRIDNVIQGLLVGRGVGCLRFIQASNSEFRPSGSTTPDERCRGMVLRMSGRLGIMI
jgi:hypothetical protein